VNFLWRSYASFGTLIQAMTYIESSANVIFSLGIRSTNLSARVVTA